MTKVEIPVLLKDKFKDKIEWMIKNYEKEISGWIEGTFNENGFICEDLLIPHQEVSHASVDTEGKDLILLLKEYKKRCQKIIGHWHSHNSMKSFWSGTDEEFIKGYMDVEGRDARLFIVSGTQDGHRIRVELRKPFLISVDELDYQTEETESPLSKELIKEIELKVRKPKPYESTTTGHYQGRVYYEKDGNLYTKESEKNSNSDDRIRAIQEISQCLFFDKKMGEVRINNVDEDFAEEIVKLWSNYNPIVVKGSSANLLRQNVIFKNLSRKKVKKVYREIYNHLYKVFLDANKTGKNEVINSPRIVTGDYMDRIEDIYEDQYGRGFAGRW